jgi:hypothetical protein
MPWAEWREDKMDLGCFIAPKAEGVEELNLGFQPISADLMRGTSMAEWFLSRRDGRRHGQFQR